MLSSPPRLLFFGICIAFAIMASGRTELGPYDTVKSAQWFAIGGVGITGVTSQEEVAFRKIHASPDAEPQLRKLLSEGTPAGKMYALFGLKVLGVPDYEMVAKPFRESKTPVRRVQGCIISMATTADVVQWIERCAGQMKAWEKRAP
jgi:hypothetical protein